MRMQGAPCVCIRLQGYSTLHFSRKGVGWAWLRNQSMANPFELSLVEVLLVM